MQNYAIVWLIVVFLVALATFFPSRKGGMCGDGWGWLCAFLHIACVFVLLVSIPVVSVILGGWYALPWGIIVAAVLLLIYYKKTL